MSSLSRPTSQIKTLGALREAGYRPRSVKQEIRDNLRARLKNGGPLFPGILGYDRTVIPSVVNALLAGHDFILLGLRGQAKTRILRSLVTLMDPEVPVLDRKSTRLNSSHANISYAVFCLKKKMNISQCPSAKATLCTT